MTALEKNRNFDEVAKIFETLVPYGRKDFSKRTFAEDFVSRVIAADKTKFEFSRENILSLLGQAVNDQDPLISPAEFLKTSGQLRFGGDDAPLFLQTLSFLLCDEKWLKELEKEILNTINDDEIMAVVYIHALGDVWRDQYEFFDNSNFNTLKLIKAIAEAPKNSLLIKRLCQAIYQTAKKEIESISGAQNTYEENAGRLLTNEGEDGYVDGEESDIDLLHDSERFPDETLDIREKVEALMAERGESLSFTERQRLSSVKILFLAFSTEESARQALSQDFGFPMNELTLREQVWFVNSLRGYQPEQERLVSSFTQKFGLNGARAFLSCEYGDRFRETVLAIGEKLPAEVAQQVFEQYGRLALLAQEKSAELTCLCLPSATNSATNYTDVWPCLPKKNPLNWWPSLLLMVSKCKLMPPKLNASF